MKKLLIVILVIVTIGCVSEVTRNLIDQTGKAGDEIMKRSSDPEVQRIGGDVKANMESVKTAVGEPRNPALEYSQAECARLRQKQAEIIEKMNWWKDAATKGIAGLLGLFGLSLPPILKKLLEARKKLSAVYTGVDDLMKSGLVKNVDQAVDILRKVADQKKVYESIKADLKKTRKA